MKKVSKLPTAAKRRVKNPGPAIKSEGNVKIVHFDSVLPIPAGRILEGAKEADLEQALVVGYDKEGVFYFAGTHGEDEKILWMLERAKHELMFNLRDDDDGDE